MGELFIGLIVFFICVGFPYLVEKDAREKKERQEEANRKRMQQELTDRWKR